MKPALLVLDTQNDFFTDDNPNLAEFERAVPAINTAVSMFRARSWPIAFVQHTSSYKPAGSFEWSIHPALDYRPDEGDIRLSKTHHNAFAGTVLAATLKANDVDLVVIVGFLAEDCVLATYRGASEEGYSAVIVREAIAGWEPRSPGSPVNRAWQMSLDELSNFLEWRANLYAQVGV